MHADEYHGTGYTDPPPMPICKECERTAGLRNVEPADCYWDGDDVAYCERHGTLTGDDFQTLRV